MAKVKKLKDLTIAELNHLCDFYYYADGKHTHCANCPLCEEYNEKYEVSLCLIADNMGTLTKEILNKEVIVPDGNVKQGVE